MANLNQQRDRSLTSRIVAWLRMLQAMGKGGGKGQDHSGEGSCNSGSEREESQRFESDRVAEQLVARIRDSRPPCPYGAAHKARQILAGLGIALFLACGASLPEPQTAAQKCQRDILMTALGGNLELAWDVLSHRRSLRDALSDYAYTDEEALQVVSDLLSCEPLRTPPPQPGDKVL